MKTLVRFAASTAVSVAIATVGFGGLASAHSMNMGNDWKPAHEVKAENDWGMSWHKKCMMSWEWRSQEGHCMKHKMCGRMMQDKHDDRDEWNDD